MLNFPFSILHFLFFTFLMHFFDNHYLFIYNDIYIKILQIFYFSILSMLQKYIDEKYNHDDESPKSSLRLWVLLIVWIIIWIILMRRLAMRLNRRMYYIRSHFRDVMKRIFLIVILFFIIVIWGIRLLNLGVKKNKK